jgi:hypothetical protein
MEREHRKHPRVAGYAKALLEVLMIPGYIRDLSRTGCQVAFMQPVAAEPGDRIDVRVMPEHDPALAPFQICLRVRWKKEDGLWFAIGGEIEAKSCPEGEGVFEKLVDYYAGPGG